MGALEIPSHLIRLWLPVGKRPSVQGEMARTGKTGLGENLREGGRQAEAASA